MADYLPVPFVPQPIDQTAQRLKLADLLYQANLARLQSEQERQMTTAKMIAQLGQQVGSGLEGWLAMQQQERNYALREQQAALALARENRLAEAQEALARRQQDAADFMRSEKFAESIPGGTQFFGPDAEEAMRRAGIFASSWDYTPAMPATAAMVAPQQEAAMALPMEFETALPEAGMPAPTSTMTLGQLGAMPAPDVTALNAILTKPMSQAELKAQQDAADRARERAGREQLSRIMADPSMSPQQRRASAEQLLAGGQINPADFSALFPRDTMTARQRFDQGLMSPEEEKAYIARQRSLRPVQAPATPQSKTFTQNGVRYRENPDGTTTIVNLPEVPAPPEVQNASDSFQTLFDATKSYVPVGLQGAFDKSVRNRLKAGDESGAARQTIMRFRSSFGTPEEKASAFARRDLEASLVRLKDLSQKAKNSGFTGNTIEEMAQWFGTSSDPQLRKFKAAATEAAAQYRRAMTGKGFSQIERDEYQSYMADAANNVAVNVNLIDTLMESVANKERAYWDQIGPDIYDYVRRVETFNRPNVSSNIANQLSNIAAAGPGRRGGR